MLNWTEQYAIIKQITSLRLRGEGSSYSFQTMGSLLGVSRGKVQAWEGGQRPSAEDLATMARVLGFRPEWLLLGEGEPLDGQAKRKSAPRTALNAKKQIIGDLLNDILALLQVDPETFAKKLKITPEQAEEILASRRKPTWDELLRIRQNFQVDIHFLLTGEGTSFAPHDLFTRLCSATGIETWNYSALARACRCEKEDMRSWVALWKQKKDPLFPPDWLKGLIETHSINPAWLYQGVGPSHLSCEEVQRQIGGRAGYAMREPAPGRSTVQEDTAGYGAPQKAAGDDTV